MNNERIIEKLTENIKLRNFAETTKESYMSKTKDVLKYFEIRKYLLKYLKEEKQLSERS